MRSFQFSDAKSHKFWQIEVTGSSSIVTYGKVGTKGQTQTKSFPSPEKAQAEADKLVREKTGKGYKETTATAAPSSDADALERGIVEHRNEGVRWAVYSDYLTEQNDPRGDFMRLQLELEDESLSAADRKKLQKQEVKILAEHERTWLGPLTAFTLDGAKEDRWDGTKRVKRPPVVHRFERGWLAALDFNDLTVNQARALTACADARLLRELVILDTAAEAPEGRTQQYIDAYYAPGPDVPATVDSYDAPSLHALSRCPHLKAVRAFQLGMEADSLGHGDKAFHLIKQMPFVEELRLYAQRVDANKLFALPMPELRELVLFHSNSYPLDKLAANKTLTNLTTIRCHPHALEFDDDESGAYIRLKHLKAICRAPHLTKLTHLCLRLTDFGDAGAQEIVASGILKRLKVLDLQGGCMSDAGAEVLANCPDLKNLDLLSLNSNALTKDGIKLLKATKVKFTADGQHGNASGEWSDGEIPDYLFEGDIE